MEQVFLKAEKRADVGKTRSRSLRKKGQIPGVVYKEGKKALTVQVDHKELVKALHTGAGHNVIISMDILADEKHSKKNVIVREIQTDPVKDAIVHIDFYEISLKDKLKVKVPVMLKGESVGVKENEGVLAQIIWEVEVECLPTEIPEHIDVRVDALRIGDAIHIKDIEFPRDVKVLVDPEQVVVTVNMPKAEEEPEKAVSEEEAVEPELIKKGKKEEEETPAEEEAQ